MPRILIVDDDAQVRATLQVMLERAGYETDEASDGKQAMRRQREEPADLIIMDLIMPEKDGLETIMEILKDTPAAKIIAISGGGRQLPGNLLLTAQLLGAAEVFSKPINRVELLDAISELLGDA